MTTEKSIAPRMLQQRTIHAIFLTAISTGLALLVMLWLGYDFSLISSAFIGDNGDTLLNSWTLYQAFDNLLHRPLDLGYSTVFYGQDDTFGFTIAPYGIAIPLLPVYVLTGKDLELTYNLYLIATFPLTTWATYLLVRYLIRAPRSIALFAGLMVTFAQFRLMHLSHIETLSTQYPLLAIYCLHRLIDTPQVRWSVGFGVFVWLTTITSGYYAAMLITVTAIVAVYTIMTRQRRITRQHIRQIAIAGYIAVLLITPFIIWRSSNNALRQGRTLEVMQAYSAEPRDWFASRAHIYYEVVPYGGEVSIFLGFVPLGLAALGWYFRRAGRSAQVTAMAEEHANGTEAHLSPPSRTTTGHAFSVYEVLILYGIILAAGYVLSLGPVLTIDGKSIAPLPYILLMQLPFFSGMRAVARFIFLAIIATALLSAFALKALSERTDRVGFALLFSAAIGFFVLEAVPFNGSASRTLFSAFIVTLNGETTLPMQPTAYTQDAPFVAWLNEQPDNTPVVHYPLYGQSSYIYYAYQPMHDQPMLNGFGNSFVPFWWHAIIEHQPFPGEAVMQLLVDRGIRYLLVHRNLLSDDELRRFEVEWESFQSTWGEAPYVGRFGDVDIYQVAPSTQPADDAS